MQPLNIRPLEAAELPLLREFLYQAIFQRDPQNLLPRSIIEQPEVAVYIQNFGQKDDYCLLAELEGQVVGAVWVRILADEPRGFGNLDATTPEFAISVLPKWRGQGIGKQLMQAMLELLAEQGYARTSLAVQKDNYACQLYYQVGFQVIAETAEEYIMEYRF